jgi:hypothetical protein
MVRSKGDPSLVRPAALAAALALALLVASPGPARAVIIDSVDGLGNTDAPADDPGWAYVGIRGGTTVVYLGLGWVLTANHVKLGEVLLDGVVYPAVPDSKIHLDPLPGTTQAPDLAVFQIDPYPGWPLMPIRSLAPFPGQPAILIGQGKNRGAPTTWDPGTGPISGYAWGPGKSLRWGTNVVSALFPEHVVGNSVTDSIATEFRENLGPDEAIAATGDSGGALFLFDAGGWELGGILFAVETYDEQPASTALYGNLTYAADVSAYRDQILDLTRTACSNESDDDGDLLIDHPADPECTTLADDSEEIDCDDGFDNDGDSFVDFPDDPGCNDALDGSERSVALVCDDDFDNDGDGWKDHPDDPGCRAPDWHTESPHCDDGKDNDGDGWTDLDDVHCTYAWQIRETQPPTCGVGFELVLLAPLLARRARRRRIA